MSNLKKSVGTLNYSKLIHEKLFNKYSLNYNHNIYIINNILSNNKSLVVAKFKELLLYEDLSEFLKRFYRLNEIAPRLKKLYNFFHKYILIQPNYWLLNESKYMISNLYRKQIIIGKQTKKQKIFNKKQKERELNGPLDKNFFSDTIYGEILNQSESFMNSLFGIDSQKIKDNNYIDSDNDKDINEVYNIIKLIDSSENNNNNKLRFGNKEIKALNNKRKIMMAGLKNNEKINTYINSTYNNSTSDTCSLINSIQNIKFSLNRFITNGKMKTLKKEIFSNNRYNINSNEINKDETELTEKNTNDNFPTKKVDKILYHRKIKSTLIGECLNKLDLPSNVNIINSLKIANEAFADEQKNNNIKIGLYKKAKFDSNNKYKTKNIFITSKYNPHHKFNSNNITRENTNISNTFNTPMKKEITFSNLYSNSRKIEIPLTQIKNKYIFSNNENSPKYTRNNIYKGLSYNNSKKMITSNINETSIKKNLFSASIQKSEQKIGNKNMFKEVYSKPKGLYNFKNGGISGNKLLNSCKV